MLEPDILKKYKKISLSHYLSNSYRNLIRTKAIHFILIIFEILLNVLQELDIFIKDFNKGNSLNNNKFNFISEITFQYNKLKNPIKIIILFFFALIFDCLYLILKTKNFIKKTIYITIIINILDLIYFRVLALIFFNLLFSFTEIYLIVSIILLSPHIYLVIDNFIYHHLYYIVPPFIEYPYDEFSSEFDLILFIAKLLLSACYSSKDNMSKFFFIILFLFQIFFSIYFLNKLLYHSYLFIKNSFLNKTKISLFLSESIILFYAILIGKTEILSIFFIIISISSVFIIISYIYFIYDPFHFIEFKKESNFEIIIYYLFIISEENRFNSLFINKLKEHYEKCGYCDLCHQYYNFCKRNEIKKEQVEITENNKEITNDEGLFNIINDKNNKYFIIVKSLIINYKNKNLEFNNNNNIFLYYYINIYFLIFSDLKTNNTLSLNEILILEKLFNENELLIENHKSHINHLLLCNEFIYLSSKTINEIKNALNAEDNINKAKKLIDLTFLLMKLKDKKYKNNIFSNKNSSNYESKNLIFSCTLLYEELFNEVISNSQIPLRDNLQSLEDVFLYNIKHGKIISLCMDLKNNKLKIIRAGNELLDYINTNLYESFPLLFRQLQINSLLSTIINNFDNNVNIDEKNNNSSIINNKTKNKKLSKIKREHIELKLVICQNISSKIYYKLLTMKISPLFSNDDISFILFDGNFNIQKYSIITKIGYDNNIKSEEKVIAVSLPDLETNIEGYYYMPLKKYTMLQNIQGYKLSKELSFDISFNLYNIYSLISKDKGKKRKPSISFDLIKESKISQKSSGINITQSITKLERVKLIEDNASVASQATSVNTAKGVYAIGISNKKKDDFHEYKNFNKIKLFIYLTIIIIIILFLIEFIHLYNLSTKLIDFNDSFIEYQIYSKYYFQLFPITLSLTCIQHDTKKCQKLGFYYFEKLYEKYPQIDYDLTVFLKLQSQRISNKLMEKRSILTKIYHLIGSENYEKYFGKKIYYSYMTQTYNNGYLRFELKKIEKKFYDAIIIMINSFHSIITDTESNSIYLLNKTVHPFTFLNDLKSNVEMSEKQMESYELLLNYKIFSEQFDSINNVIQDLLSNTSKKIEIFIYIYLHLNIGFFLFVIILMYLLLVYFQNIIIKIINFINMAINTKSDSFSFNEKFSKKLYNLEIILKMYNEEAVKAIENINNIYRDYRRYIINKNKKELDRRGSKKNTEKENTKKKNKIPKNQRIIGRNEIHHLNLFNKYILIIFLVSIFSIIVYIYILFLWIKYFNKRVNLHILIGKNTDLESTLYNSINIYYLMIFNNYTLSEVTEDILFNYYNKEDNFSILKSFYKDLMLIYNSQVEKDDLNELYESFEKTSNFSCKLLYEKNDEFLEEMEETQSAELITEIEDKLIELCINSKIEESEDSKNVFERHFQYIINEIISIKDTTYNGLIQHIKKGNMGRIAFFYSNVIIFLCEIIFHKPNKKTLNNFLALLSKNIKISEILFLIVLVAFVIIILFLLIAKIKNFCEQILLLKNVFKIAEIQDQ